EDTGWPLRAVMQRIAREGKGVVVVLGRPEDGDSLLQRIRMHARNPDAEPHRSEPGQQLRTYGVGAQILAELGVAKMRVLSAPKNLHGISGFGLEVVDYVTE
ncbi:MAG: bifunctional 3,4-dihydroxy-2-butanone-4-phosphate synthase/GTP cyclohydrolase II, partial [Gammaproteobacteria bacterium]